MCPQIEYLVLAYDEENKNACLSLRQAEILKALASDEQLQAAGGGVPALNEIKESVEFCMQNCFDV
jgi:glutamate--cysteine ligase catalytic subunit